MKMTPRAFLLCLGIGASKKTAKNEAAKATLHLLIPELKEKLKFGDEAGGVGGSEEAAKAAEEREKQGGNSILGPKLLLVMGCVKLGEKNCVQREQNAN